MRQFSNSASNVDNYSGGTSEERHSVSLKQNSVIEPFYFFLLLAKCVYTQFCCSSSTGYGIMRVDGFIFLAYDCHIQVHYSDLNSSTYAKAIFIVGLCSYRLLYIKNVFM